jgi:hypothetical protein
MGYLLSTCTCFFLTELSCLVTQKHNTGLIVSMVREQFKKNMHETDPEKIQKMKDE